MGEYTGKGLAIPSTVALYKDFGRLNETLICLGICLAYDLLLDLSVLCIWSYFGIIRVGLAVYILY